MIGKVFLVSTTVDLNHSAEGREPNPDIRFCKRAAQIILPQVNWTRFVLLHQRSLLHKISEVLLKTLPVERNPFPAKDKTRNPYRVHISRTKWASSALIQIESVTDRLLKAAQRMLGSCNAALRTGFENHCSTSNTTPASHMSQA